MVEQRQFGAWGSVDKFLASTTLGNPNEFGHESFLGRGYTGHEHFFEVSLIHMNGRMYDPVQGRFLSPDNYIQDPFNTQNYNRYGYVLNNPLMYMDANGEFFWAAVIIGAVIGAVSQAIRPGANFGTIVGGGLIGAVAGMVGAGVGSVVAGGAFFGSGVAATVSTGSAAAGGFGSGFVSGAASGFAGGFVGGTGTAWLNGANFGNGLGAGLKSGVIGAAVGGMVNGVVSEVKYQNQLGTFRKGLNQLDVNADDSVPMTDEYLKKAQSAWFKKTPKNLLRQSVEDVPQRYISKMSDAGAAAVTVPTVKGGILTGNASIYYNPGGGAFTSAKQLFFTMSHEMVHVSQYGVLGSLGMSIRDFNNLYRNGLSDVFEFHAYSFESSLGSTNYGAFTSMSGGSLMRAYPELFKSLNYINFPWTQTVGFILP